MLHNPKWDRPNTEVQQTLLDAAALIEKHGHLKFDMGNTAKGFCISGAIAIAVKGDASLWMESMGAINIFLHKTPGNHYRLDVIRWNNALERTGDEVIAVLKDTAHAL